MTMGHREHHRRDWRGGEHGRGRVRLRFSLDGSDFDVSVVVVAVVRASHSEARRGSWGRVHVE